MRAGLQWIPWTAGLVFTVVVALPAFAVTITGTLTNETHGRPGTAQSVRLIDLAGGMNQIGLVENVTGEFEFTDVETTGPQLLVQVQCNDVLYSQPVSPGESHVEFTVYDSTESTDGIVVSMQHAIFQRSGDQIDVMEFVEYRNDTSPPLAVTRPNGAIMLAMPADILGEVEVSVSAGRMPLRQELLETDDDAIFTVDYALRPGTTRMVMRYSLPYPDASLDWTYRAFFPVEKTSVLVSPDDIAVTADGFHPAEGDTPPPEGFAAFVGPELAAGDAVSISLAGGSQQSADPHAGLNMNTAPQGEITVRPNRLHEPRVFIVVGLTGILLAALALLSGGGSIVRESPAKMALEDSFVAGSIDRTEFLRQRDQLRRNASSSRAGGSR